MKPNFNERRVLHEIKRTFNDAEIISYKLLKGGLVSPVYKVKIRRPLRYLAVKIYKAKNEKMIQTNNNVLKFLSERNFPVPKIYSNRLFTKQGIAVMEFIKGKAGLDVYNKSSLKVKSRLLLNMGKLLRRLHNLPIPAFWVHHKHEVNDIKSWLKWNKVCVMKYLKFAHKEMDIKYYLFLKKEFNLFLNTLNQNIDFVPIHWDYHLSNVLASSNGEIVGIFDFDNAMKGHNLADIGQAKYWLRFRSNGYKNFKYLLRGYGLKIDNKNKILIRGYFILHLIAVNRSIWKKKKLNWIIKEHCKILDELMREEK